MIVKHSTEREIFTGPFSFGYDAGSSGQKRNCPFSDGSAFSYHAGFDCGRAVYNKTTTYLNRVVIVMSLFHILTSHFVGPWEPVTEALYVTTFCTICAVSIRRFFKGRK